MPPFDSLVSEQLCKSMVLRAGEQVLGVSQGRHFQGCPPAGIMTRAPRHSCAPSGLSAGNGRTDITRSCRAVTRIANQGSKRARVSVPPRTPLVPDHRCLDSTLEPPPAKNSASSAAGLLRVRPLALSQAGAESAIQGNGGLSDLEQTVFRSCSHMGHSSEDRAV